MCETIHFANLVDLCHLKNAEHAKIFKKYQGRVAPGQHQGRTWLQSSIRLPKCIGATDGSGKIRGHNFKTSMIGEGSDAVSAYHQFKMVDAPDRWCWRSCDLLR